MIDKVPHMRLHRLHSRSAGMFSAYLQILQRDLDRIRCDIREQARYLLRQLRSLRGQAVAETDVPGVCQQRLANHDPVRARRPPVLAHVLPRPDVAVAHHRNPDALLQDAHLLEVRCALPPTPRRDMPGVEGDP